MINQSWYHDHHYYLDIFNASRNATNGNKTSIFNKNK